MAAIVIIKGGENSLSPEEVQDLKNKIGDDITIISPEEAMNPEYIYKSNVINLSEREFPLIDIRAEYNPVVLPSKRNKQQEKLRQRYFKK